MQFSMLVPVALGGACGAVLRHLAVMALGAPWAVAAVNVLGSFLIGLAWVALAGRDMTSALLITGLLGGFTTFSAFSLDTVKLIGAGRLAEAALYVLVSVFLSLAAVALGTTIARSLA